MGDKNERTKIEFSAPVIPQKPVNDEFTLVKIYVHGLGKNRNFTYFGRENTDRCLATLPYVPVVGHIREYEDEDGNVHHWMGGHDGEIDWGRFVWKDLTVPYGVVMPDTFTYEDVVEYSETVTYLVANAILWTGRYPELKDCIYSDENWFAQSMEVSVKDYRPLSEDEHYTEILDWNYSGLCLLGKADSGSTNGQTNPKHDTKPCFISAHVEPVYSLDDKVFSDLYSEMKKDLENINFAVDSGKEEDEMDENTNVKAEFDAYKESHSHTNEEYDNLYSLYRNVVDEGVALNSEYSEYKSNHSHTDDEYADYEKLRKYHDEAETAKRKAEIDEIFNRFAESLDGNSEFINLKNHLDDYENVSDIETACYLIFGKVQFSNRDNSKKNPVNKKSAKIRVNINADSNEDTENDDEPYGDVSQYL